MYYDYEYIYQVPCIIILTAALHAHTNIDDDVGGSITVSKDTIIGFIRNAD